MKKLLKITYIALGIACILYYFVLWRASRLGLSMSGMWPAIGAVLILCGLLCDSRAIPRWAHVAWRACLCLGLAGILALECRATEDSLAIVGEIPVSLASPEL